ncbi:uncharacterized protein LOC118427782 [Branchiostoma floridae]|uniref:Uncharacterized protein LOC118427782 n=1 Tax=Branchiostoma floridae TaxID=7739 RepID=A0A9J7N832_BRAFL|nr:uncharacterized protein LOC118427782 [Branchiostoma floridae]
MRVFLLIAALLLATAVLMTESSRRRSSGRRRSRGGRRRSWYRRRGYVAGDGDFEKRREEKLQNARDMLENLMNDVEEGAFLDMGKGQDQEMEGADGDTFEKKMATYQETEDELDEENDAVEEDAALGLMEEELEELQEEVEEVIGNLGGTN